jgi:predicted RNA-binding Zn-ribbon protein involved in translation (DUF1610 family)
MRRNIFRGVTKEEIEELYLRQNRTDAEIGALIGVSDAAVSWFRRRNGIATKSQLERLTFGHDGPSFKDITPIELATIYSSMGLRGVAKLYGVSKFTVTTKCRKFGIRMISKSERATSSDEFTDVQKEVILGSLLGDGYLSESGYFKVTHYQEQLGYLLHTHKEMAPHTLPIFYEENELDTGTLAFAFGYRTVQHAWLRGLRSIFYPSGEKVFPIDVLRNLTLKSLAYWYFDDGHLDGLPSFALGDIPLDMAQMVAREVSSRFSVQAYIKSDSASCKIMSLRGASSDVFFELIREYAPQCMLYKFPPKHWPKGVVSSVPTKTKDPFIIPMGLVKEAKRWNSLETDEDRSSVVDAFVRLWEGLGFPQHVPKPEELTTLIALDPSQVIQDGVVKARQVGQGICQGICTHIWDAHSFGGSSPKEIFSDPLRLREVIRFCLASGYVPNASRLRGALRYWKRSGVYNFRPSAAKALADLYCPQGGVILDPCAGYGGRLLGSILSKSSPIYVGYDPATETFDNLHRLHHWVTSFLPQLSERVRLLNQPAEEADFPEVVDLVMTSPPYWKREVYSEEATQSGIRFETYAAWLEGFWKKVLTKSVTALKPGGWLILNVDDFRLEGKNYSLIADTAKICAEFGLGSPIRLVYALPGADGSSDEVVLLWPKGPGIKVPVSGIQEVAQLELALPTCRICGKVTSIKHLKGGACASCLVPLGYPIKCRGCGLEFQATTKNQLFHNEACYGRYRRRLAREASPPTGIRTFTCSTCLKRWETKDLGQFKQCPSCKEQEDIESRTKTCDYRHCGISFVDTSPHNSMAYCCPEHRRREKLFRSGVARDVSYFRDTSIKYQPKCIQCHNKWQPNEGEKNNKCPACRELRRVKTCRKCGSEYKDPSENNTRRYCFSCRP